MKKTDLIFGALKVPVDYIMLVIAGVFAYSFRFSHFYITYIKEATVTIAFPDYVKTVLIMGFVYIIIFAFAGLYSLRFYKKFFDEFVKIFLACSTGILFVVVYIFFNREFFASRFIVLFAWFLSIVLVAVGRFFILEIQKYLYKRGKFGHYVAIIGKNKASDALVDYYKTNPDIGYRVVAVFDNFDSKTVDELEKMKSEDMLDEIFLSDLYLGEDEKNILTEFVNANNLEFKYTGGMLGFFGSKTVIDTIAGMPFVEIKKTSLDGWGRIIKRLFDVAVALLAIFVLLPLFLILSIGVKISSRGPVFYKSKRCGYKGKEFYLYKFRSMKHNTHHLKYTVLQDKNLRSDGPLFKMKDDPRVTKFGKFIRKWSLDEIPQFFNVLKGDMSLVGPRPHEVEEVVKYHVHHKHLLDIKPGITGLAQVSGRSDLTFEEEAKLDIYYLENWSLWLDLKIIFQTPKAVIGRRKAE